MNKLYIFLSDHSDVAAGAIISLLFVWITTNFIGKPIILVIEKRSAAIKTAELYRNVNCNSLEERQRSARLSLNDSGTSLRSLARTQPWFASVMCKIMKYDLEKAAGCLLGLATMMDGMENTLIRQNQIDALYICLNAYRHLNSERVKTVKRLLEDASQGQ